MVPPSENRAVQYVTDENGKQTAALIPIEEWHDIEDVYLARRQLRDELSEAFLEVEDVKAGRKKGTPIEDILNDL